MNYVLHLADRKDREETMVQELDSFCPGEWEVWPGRREPNAKLGISRSIRALVAFAQQQALASVLMFEDDVEFFSSRSRAQWDECVLELPPDWHLLLGGSYAYCGAQATPHLKKLSNFCSLHCVLFRDTVYETVLRHQPEQEQLVPGDIDCWLSTLGLNVYLCDPQVAVQHNGFSDNAKAFTNYDNLLADFNLLK
jgi:hypothetical protein